MIGKGRSARTVLVERLIWFRNDNYGHEYIFLTVSM